MAHYPAVPLKLALAVTLLALAGNALAEGPYIGVRGGNHQLRDMTVNTNINSVNTSYSSGRSFSIVAGAASFYESGFRGRFELEAGQQSGEVSGSTSGRSGDTRSRFGFLNVYGDNQINDTVDFFFGGGVGFGEVEFDDHRTGFLAPRLNDRDTSFGYQVGAGLAASLSERVSLELGYRFQSWENLDVTTSDGRRNELRLSSHNVLLGLRLGI